jgi:hypothetical protein
MLNLWKHSKLAKKKWPRRIERTKAWPILCPKMGLTANISDTNSWNLIKICIRINSIMITFQWTQNCRLLFSTTKRKIPASGRTTQSKPFYVGKGIKLFKNVEENMQNPHLSLCPSQNIPFIAVFMHFI